ncbi:helix-turn-helix domain-containing protein [Hyalangium gracile]|uniref:helix-turn-helix domain-containing protein n=1 Tax=Hyalangium gracile TaxID=394092 RepID=UPI001CCCCC41|nr:helix-turn-helix transcriptional regulator [Hyalangium gracile]
MNEELARKIGEAAREARQRAGLTQAEVASLVEITSMVYSRMERGKVMPSVPTLRRLCTVLHISADALLGLTGTGAADEPTSSSRGKQEESPPGLRRLLTLVLRMDETQLQALTGMAGALLR